MGKVTWAPSALEDVNSIAEYIARDSVDRAALFAVRLIEAVKLFMVTIVLCIVS